MRKKLPNIRRALKNTVANVYTRKYISLPADKTVKKHFTSYLRPPLFYSACEILHFFFWLRNSKIFLFCEESIIKREKNRNSKNGKKNFFFSVACIKRLRNECIVDKTDL